MELSGFMMGLRAAGIEIDKIFKPYFDAYVKEFLDEELVQNNGVTSVTTNAEAHASATEGSR